MRQLLLASLLTAAVLGLGACAPRTGVAVATTVTGVSVNPVLLKLSASARRGGSVTLQGRYLGGPATAQLFLGASESGLTPGSYQIPASAISSWTDSQIVFTVPSTAPTGGSWVYVRVGQLVSSGLTISIGQ